MRLIDADKMYDEIAQYRDDGMFGGGNLLVDDVLEDINLSPTVDAEPVRHGKWYTAEKYNGYLYWNCDQCHQHFTSQKSNFCPNCGAKMDGE